MSRFEENCRFRASVAKVQDENLDISLDKLYRPALLATLMDISISLAVIADKLGENNEYCEDGIELLTDTEQRIFLSAMRREREVCRAVDELHCNIDSEKKLVKVCNSIERKVKKIWE